MPSLHQAYRLLLEAYGPQGWWPASSPAGTADPWEVIVGAILVQNTAWANAVRAIAALEKAQLMSVASIHMADANFLAEVIRPAGTSQVKAKRLQAFASFVVEEYDGSVDLLLEGVSDRHVAHQRRTELLEIHGVGPETADAILLYAGGAPVFVVDAYKRRIMARHGWGDAGAGYDEVATFWRQRLPAEAEVYAETHALLVEVGKRHCKKRESKCEGCPLQGMLPRSGPLEC